VNVGALGRRDVSPKDPRDLRLADYVDLRHDAPPMARNWTIAERYPWLMNDRLGCCTITGIAHFIQNAALANDEIVAFSDAEIVAAYSAVTGYDPADPTTDRGGVMVNALTYARRVGIGGKKIGAFVRVDVGDHLEVQAAINLFGGIYVGAALPKRIREQLVWTVPVQREMNDLDTPGGLGGHAFLFLGYDRHHVRALPWRNPTFATVEWMKLYVDEAWAIIDERWVTRERPAPNGFDIDRLTHNLSVI